MNRLLRLEFPFAALAAFLLAPSIDAHEREYTLSRDWFLPSVGEHEIESRTFWNTRLNSVQQSFEYEYGVTHWFAIEPGVEFVHDEEETFEMESVELELRFHFWKFEYERVLPALTVEYEHELEDDEADHGELQFIGAWYGETGHDFALNLNLGRELESGGENDSEATFGYVRPLTELDPGDEAGNHTCPRIGVEGVDDFEEHHLGAGPLFVYRGNDHLNVVAAYVFGLDEREENGDELRLILEWEF